MWSLKLDPARLAVLPPVPPIDPLEVPDLADRVRGMLLGVAIGDALGNRTESMLPAAREAEHGRITGYLPSRYANGEPAGTPSDDTQLTCRAIEQLLHDGALDADELAFRIANDRIFGIGKATRDFCNALRTGAPWYEATQYSAGNGALMRITPMLLPHLRTGGTALWTDTALATAVTHNEPLAISSSVAWVALLWRLLNGDVPETPVEWLDTYTEVLRVLDDDQQYDTRVTAGPLQHWRGSLSQLLHTYVRDAVTRGTPVRIAAQQWFSGAFLLETGPTVLHIVAQHGHDPREALLVAVNDTRDNDTMASIVGGAMGAAHGTAWIPVEWRTQLLGRINGDDDGRLFTLIDDAVARFVG
ncbi:MAG: ADP-ribosylglycohydrolase family protein [Gemmatimonas sp.]|uniref:ADP-ribosylglycohydrolase family protein n=1 Tax=Gemmatimonas sp. TaxID=1962908 RepID=UPI0025B8802D|nr:ADP-ribosylglycohydrolase family protein [Gemmatimonas sp.]MCA2988705.1 ADP-ribosylglycohydrolase family protein [Gemmatimonas sp.]